jgi:hypothetical protein
MNWLAKHAKGTINVDSIIEVARCSFCWQGTPTPRISDHVIRDCPLLKRFNNKRASAKFRPIHIESGKVSMDDSKEPVSLDEVVSRLDQVSMSFEEQLAKLESRIKALEKESLPKPKRKAEDHDSAPGPSK